MTADGDRCPICGHRGLSEPARTAESGGSYEVCQSCGFEFGVTDDDSAFSDLAWRWLWIAQGMPWSSLWYRPQPADWDPEAQLAAVGGTPDRPMRLLRLGAQVKLREQWMRWRLQAGSEGMVESVRDDVPVYGVRMDAVPETLFTLAHGDLQEVADPSAGEG